MQQIDQQVLDFVADTATWDDFVRDESGQDLIEYALVAALVALGVITAMRGLGIKIGSAFNSISSTVTSTV